MKALAHLARARALQAQSYAEEAAYHAARGDADSAEFYRAQASLSADEAARVDHEATLEVA